MDWIEVKVHTTTAGADLVSEQLMQEGATGTMVEDRADVPDPDKPTGYWEMIDPDLIQHMPEDVVVHAWFEPDHRYADRMQALRDRLEQWQRMELGMDLGSLDVETQDVKEEDWAEVWKRFYKPFHAGKTLVVKPTWESYTPQEGDRIIEIDPGMAFGSGTHETTSMCLGFLEDYLTPGVRVIDVGTGSGILAIGAALLGAGKVLAIDIDPTAVKVARENVAHNHLEEKIQCVQGDLLEQRAEQCDLCVANIIADVICSFAAPLQEHIVPGGLFVCSGIIREREQDVLDALQQAGYELVEERKKGEWVAMISRRPA